MYFYGTMYYLNGKAVTGIYPKEDAITPKRKPLSLKEIHASEDLKEFWNSHKHSEQDSIKIAYSSCEAELGCGQYFG